MSRLKDFSAVKKKWLKDRRVKKEYDSLGEEFQLAEELIKARMRADMTQAAPARKIGTKAPAISRLESPGYGRASVAVLRKVAHALDCDLKIRLVPRSTAKRT